MHSVLQASDGYQYAFKQVILLSSLVVLLTLFGNIQEKTFYMYPCMAQYNANNHAESDIIKIFLIDSSIINKLFMCVSVGCSFIGDTHLSVDKPLEFCEFKGIAYFWSCNQSQ